MPHFLYYIYTIINRLLISHCTVLERVQIQSTCPLDSRMQSMTNGKPSASCAFHRLWSQSCYVDESGVVLWQEHVAGCSQDWGRPNWVWFHMGGGSGNVEQEFAMFICWILASCVAIDCLCFQLLGAHASNVGLFPCQFLTLLVSNVGFNSWSAHFDFVWMRITPG